MEKEGSFKFVLIRVPPKPSQESTSSDDDDTATELSLCTNFLLPSVLSSSSSCVQENQEGISSFLHGLFSPQKYPKEEKGKQESHVSTELSLSISRSSSNCSGNKSQPSVALSNVKKPCSNTSKNASQYLSTELSLSISSSICDDQNSVKPSTASNKRKSCPNPPKNAVKRMCGSGRNGEETNRGYLTDSKLYKDPWKIKKVLMASDIGNLCRLLLATDLVEKYMLPFLSVDAQRDSQILEKGIKIGVWDVDTKSMHYLVLKHWVSSRSYVLIGGWNPEFVKRRCLTKGDEIGLHFDTYKHCFNFSILKRS